MTKEISSYGLVTMSPDGGMTLWFKNLEAETMFFLLYKNPRHQELFRWPHMHDSEGSVSSKDYGFIIW